MTDPLVELLAKQRITEALYRYCRGLDRMDRELALSVWHEEGTADYPETFAGTAADFVDWVWEAHAKFSAHSHQVTNVLIEVDGEHATSEAYVTVALREERGDGTAEETVSRGRYVDRWSRRDGRWAIDHRRYVADLGPTSNRTAPAGAVAPGGGSRDRCDASYAMVSRWSSDRTT